MNITPARVDAELPRYAEGANKPHYLVSEIFLPVDNPEQGRQGAEGRPDVEGQLKPARVLRHGRASVQPDPAAAAGGDIGWVHEGQLAPELNAALTKMAVDTVSPPIRSIGGYYILALRARQEPLGTKIDTTTDRRDQSRRHPAAGAPAVAAGRRHHQGDGGQRMKLAAKIRSGFNGCDELSRAADKMPRARSI